MARIQPTIDSQKTNFIQVQWDLGNADYGTPFTMPEYSDKTVHIAGTFGSATVVLYGSNLDSDLELEPTVSGSWIALKDVNDANVSATSNAGFTIVNNYTHITARSSGGTGTAVTVTVNGKKVN